MYHTEGYLDKYTYFAGDHIWSQTIWYQGKVCYFWCVLEQELRGECSGDMKRNVAKIRSWMQLELVCALEKGQVAIQKELNRFGACLNAEQNVIKLYFYYQGKLFLYDNGFFGGREKELQQYFAVNNAGIGFWASPSVLQLPETQELLEKNGVKDKKQKIGLRKKVNKHSDISIEKLGNHLKTAMLRAMSEGRLEQGYFLLWEDEDVI